MPLVKATLETAIQNLIADMRTKENNAGVEFAQGLTTIIDDYVKSATITVPSGIPVSTAGTAAAQTGATTAPATATIGK